MNVEGVRDPNAIGVHTRPKIHNDVNHENGKIAACDKNSAKHNTKSKRK